MAVISFIQKIMIWKNKRNQSPLNARLQKFWNVKKYKKNCSSVNMHTMNLKQNLSRIIKYLATMSYLKIPRPLILGKTRFVREHRMVSSSSW